MALAVASRRTVALTTAAPARRRPSPVAYLPGDKQPQHDTKNPSTFKNQLEALRSMTKVVADTGDPALVARYAPQDSTTNPSLVLKAAEMPRYEHLLREALAAAAKHDSKLGAPGRPTSAAADLLSVAIGAEMLKIVPGRVSTEVDAHLSHDKVATYDRALRLVDAYAARGVPTERLYIKVASTWAGARAAERLQGDGVDVNMTLLFSFAQAAAAADAGAALVSPFVGRILDWHKAKHPGREYAPAEDPGVLSVKRIYAAYKAAGVRTVVMAASFRNADEIRQLAGVDNITISPALLGELEACDAPLERALWPGMGGVADEADVALLRRGGGLTRAEFDALHGADAMAVEKLAQGIESFAADQDKLEAVLARMAAGGAAA